MDMGTTQLTSVAVRAPTVLLAEDSYSLRNAACKLLERAGFEVLGAADGVEAFNIIGFEHDRIDVLITDLEMPKMSGAELIERARTLIPELRVIIISGRRDSGRRGACELGDLNLDKPFTADALIDAVRQLTGTINAGATPSHLAFPAPL